MLEKKKKLLGFSRKKRKKIKMAVPTLWLYQTTAYILTTFFHTFPVFPMGSLKEQTLSCKNVKKI